MNSNDGDNLYENEEEKLIINSMSYDERRQAMLMEASSKGIRPILLQKKYKVSLGGTYKGDQRLRTKIWNELGEAVLTEGADKFKEELFKLKGQEFMKHWEIILQYFKPRSPQYLNVNVQNKIEIGFKDEEQEIIQEENIIDITNDDKQDE